MGSLTGVVVRGSAKTFASPITVVLERDYTIRICVDYVVLNAHSRPLILINSLSKVIHESK